MGEAPDDHASHGFLAALDVGDVCHGTATEVTRSHVAMTLDGFPAHPLGTIGTLDVSWRQSPDTAVEVGQRITAEVIAIDREEGRARMSMTATENPELWAFLASLRPGEILSGAVAAIERFGVFVALDDGPDHPVHPGVGFITIPESSWRRFETPSDVVRIGQHLSGEFLEFDSWNGEARLSLRATQPDPFQAFADGITVGRTLHGQVTELVPFGAFVQVADGVEGLIHLRELTATPVEAPEKVVQVGDDVSVVVIEFDREQRKLTFSRQMVSPDQRPFSPPAPFATE